MTHNSALRTTKHGIDMTLAAVVARAKASAISHALIASNGNVSEAAKILHISRSHLYTLMADAGITIKREMSSETAASIWDVPEDYDGGPFTDQWQAGSKT